MSLETNEFERVLFKLAQDESFRDRFQNDRNASLKDFRLSAIQITALLALNVAAFVALVGPAFAGGGKGI